MRRSMPQTQSKGARESGIFRGPPCRSRSAAACRRRRGKRGPSRRRCRRQRNPRPKRSRTDGLAQCPRRGAARPRCRRAACSAPDQTSGRRRRRTAGWPCGLRGDAPAPGINRAASKAANPLLGAIQPPESSPAKRSEAGAPALGIGERSYKGFVRGVTYGLEFTRLASKAGRAGRNTSPKVRTTWPWPNSSGCAPVGSAGGGRYTGRGRAAQRGWAARSRSLALVALIGRAARARSLALGALICVAPSLPLRNCTPPCLCASVPACLRACPRKSSAPAFRARRCGLRNRPSIADRRGSR